MKPQEILRFLKFCIVGASGVAVNMGAFWLLYSKFHIYDLVANPIAIEISIISNFLLNDFWTWRDRRNKPFLVRLVQYNITTSAVAAVTDMLVLWLLTRYLGMDTYISKAIGIVLGTILNFTINHFWTFGGKSD